MKLFNFDSLALHCKQQCTALCNFVIPYFCMESKHYFQICMAFLNSTRYKA